MKKLWFSLFLLLIILSIWIGWHQFPSSSQPYIEEYKPSPPIRLLVESKVQSTEIQIDPQFKEPSQLFISRAEKPLQFSSHQIHIKRHQGVFELFNNQETHPWIEFKFPSPTFFLNGRELPGNAKVHAHNDELFNVINILDIEPYLARVVQAEMNPNWPIETLKAQAIVARSYALFHAKDRKRRSYDLYGTSRSMAYKPSKPHPTAYQAVKETYGIVLRYKDQILPSFFLSTCGGGTDDAELSFPRMKNIKPLQGVDCSYCKDSPHYQWNAQLNLEEWKSLKKSWFNSEQPKLIQVLAKKQRVIALRFKYKGKTRDIKADRFRRSVHLLKKSKPIKSLHFDIQVKATEVILKGNGWGYHGVGMCQYGSKGLGEQSWTCFEILNHYYPGAEFGHAYP